VKAWPQSTMSDERLPGLYMTSVQSEKMSKDKQVLSKGCLIALSLAR